MAGSSAVFAKQTFFRSPGVPAANCRLTTYAANTSFSTLASTWQDKDQTTLNANPIILDSDGTCTMWVTPGSFYDAILRDEFNVATIRSYEDITGANSSPQTTSGQWVQWANAPTYVDPNTFTVPGNQTASFQKGRKILSYMSAGFTPAGTIVNSVFGTVTTVTVRFPLSATVLNSSLSRVDLSLITPVSSPIWAGDNSVIDLTGYTGADINLYPGQMNTYTLSAVTSLLLRTACGTNQLYELDILLDQTAGANNATLTSLLVNNAALGAANITYQTDFGSAGAAVASTTTTTVYGLDTGNIAYRIKALISTRTQSKSCFSEFFSLAAASVPSSGAINNAWIDTVTAHTSVGTINFNRSVSGIVTLRRIA
jgi:hypothetical protein